jgi:hypothetical protein
MARRIPSERHIMTMLTLFGDGQNPSIGKMSALIKIGAKSILAEGA